MGNLLATLLSSSGALRAYSRVLDVTQNNVANASTPGYAKQSVLLQALTFEPDRGTTGGVRAGEVESARNEYAEQSVRRQTVALGEADQQVNSLTALESLFDVTGTAGVPGALNRLYQSFSEWGVNPNSSVSRQAVVDRAGDLARAFNQAAAGVSRLVRDTGQQLQATVERVNTLVEKLSAQNYQIRQGGQSDVGLDATVHSTLEELSQEIDISAIPEADGSTTVLLNGSTALVVGDRAYPLKFDFVQPADPPPDYPGSPPVARVSAPDGSDITASITTGRLGALLDIRNRTLAGLAGGAYQPGELNRLAMAVADRVNGILTSGTVSDGPPAVPGGPLFTYDVTNATAAAFTLAVDPTITPDSLAATDPGPPYVSNGIALRLSALAAPQADADKIDGFSFTEYYGVLAGRVGRDMSDAQTNQQVQQSLVAQAKDLRQQASGVSLDEEATILIQFQRAYQANARMITVLDQMTEALINILR
jgi:flagellar hook-associated protein 1